MQKLTGTLRTILTEMIRDENKMSLAEVTRYRLSQTKAHRQSQVSVFDNPDVLNEL